MTSSKDEDDDDSPVMAFDDVDVRVEALTSSIPISALDDTEYDVIMTSLLCMGSAVVLTSLGALIATAARRRIQYHSQRRVKVSELTGQRLLAGAAALNNRGDKQTYLYYPTATITSCSTLIGPNCAERGHNDVAITAFPEGVVAMEAANKLYHDQRCGACVGRGLKERHTVDERTSNGVRLTLTWPQAAADCDSSNCYCSTFGSLDSCASI